MWNSLLGAVSIGDRLEAAWKEIHAERRKALDGEEPSLILTHRIDVAGQRLTIDVGTDARRDARQISVDLPLIERAVNRRFSPLRLVALRLVEDVLERRRDDFPEIDRSSRPGIDELGAPDQTVERVYQSLSQMPDVVLVGGPGTQKTISAAIVAYQFEREGHACAWLDVRDGRAGAETIAWELLRLPRHDDILVVVNQVQDRMSEVGPAFALTQKLRTDFRLPARVLATGRPAIVDRDPLFQSFRRVPTPAPDHLPATVPEREIVYWFACLKLLEIRPPTAIVRRRFPEDLIHRLSRGPDSFLSHNSAHYSLASGRDAPTLIRRLRSTTPPGDVIWEYLKLIGRSAGSDLLHRLDQGDFRGGATGGRSYLRPAWNLLFDLGTQLDDHCARDPGWGENVGAAVFAAEALAELGHHSQWQEVARFVRGRWRYDQPRVLPEPADQSTRESEDFVEIARYMDLEDAYLSVPDLGLGPANTDQIDFERFYRTWMLGVLLGFEATALHKADDLRRSLVRTAEAQCQPEGFFYPSRVPWVTARVVLGLCRAGETYQNSTTVRRACEWLKRPRDKGGPYGGWWKGGTGSWNRDEATTAMCVAALIRAGDGDAPEVHTALAWLRARDGEWTKTDREIDLALVLEATLLGAADWRSSYGRILNLLHWATAEIHRKTIRQPEPRFVPENALRAPFAAAQLAILVRVSVARECEALLGQTAVRRLPRQRPVYAPPPSAGTSPSGGLLLLPNEQRWKRAARAIAETLENRIKDRSAVLERDSLRRASDIWQQVEGDKQRLARCLELEDRLKAPVNPDDLEALIELGRAVRGAAWDEGLTYKGRPARA
ncbi:hypothetical protein [Actinoplanes subtropicus]|uniref:hypothetical protein n=1 Tax=Actinoplanes subtropicus TaxID=543632 RepID=UPI0004C470C6|nr:hypothetical protein [Actinoplanes subtropicus]